MSSEGYISVLQRDRVSGFSPVVVLSLAPLGWLSKSAR